MSTLQDKISRRRARTSYFSTLVGITLVLTMLGLMILFLLNAGKVSSYIKEDLKLQVYLKKELNEVDIQKTNDILSSSRFVNSTRLIKADEAAREMEELFGDDFISKLDGLNPLPNTVEVSFKENYIQRDSLQKIEGFLAGIPQIQDTSMTDFIGKADLITTNIKRIGVALLVASVFLLLIAFALINNTIRLSIYAKRFLIRSMQLIGAKASFIQKPFIVGGLLQGLISGVLAIGSILGIIYLFDVYLFQGFFKFQDLTLFIKLFGVIIMMGVLITLLSTIFAVRKFSRMKMEDLH